MPPMSAIEPCSQASSSDSGISTLTVASEYPVAFAFCHLLGFHLLPRLKRIHAQRLYRPVAGEPDAYSGLRPVLSRPIDWDLIRRQYNEMVKFVSVITLSRADREYRADPLMT